MDYKGGGDKSELCQSKTKYPITKQHLHNNKSSHTTGLIRRRELRKFIYIHINIKLTQKLIQREQRL